MDYLPVMMIESIVWGSCGHGSSSKHHLEHGDALPAFYLAHDEEEFNTATQQKTIGSEKAVLIIITNKAVS